MRGWSWKAAAAGVALLWPQAATAVDMTVPVDRVVWITNEWGESRALLGFASVRGLVEEWVVSAALVLPLRPVVASSRIPVEVYGLERSWSAGATWTSPWVRPGGDTAAREVVTGEIEAGRRASAVSIDVTDLVRSMAAGEAPEHGLLLMPAAGTRGGFGSAERTVLGTLQGARVEVTYRKLTALGIRGGMGRQMERKSSAVAPDRDR